MNDRPKMNKQAILIFCVFAVALASGIILGNGLSKKVAADELEAHKQQQAERDPRKRQAIELGLTPEQQEKQAAIYDQAWAEGQKIDERRRQSDREREEALAKFLEKLSPEQRGTYEKIQSDHRKQREQIGKESEEVFTKRRDAFKRILTPEQLAKYEELQKNRPQFGFGRRWGSQGRDGARGGSRGPAETRPGTEPANH